MAQAKISAPVPGEQSAPAVQDGHSTGAEVSERPVLAAGVELSGEMQESGFAEQQWLVQREGQFIQLTRLLYQLLEQVDGKRTLEEIAHGLSDATNRRVSVDNVRQLLERKLIPMGLVARADGSVARSTDAGVSRSPLRINMRTSVITPALINPVTRVLQLLYWPPIVICILLVTVLAQGWLFFVHGIGHSVYQVLYQPGYMLALLGIIVVATAFHEFGHASALRYGGGQVRGMGVGLYLVYPAFYTDVTDNYRLSRWSKVRTDLGGFYFNLIFALLMLGLYTLTRLEILLLVVVFVDMEIIQQTLPFVRLDGYWALADLTGLPDFFSQIGPFLRTVLPLPWWRDSRKLPYLKGWVKAVFAIYILITVPLLIVLFFLMLKSVPRVLATAWDSMGKQGHAIAVAAGDGNILGLVASVLQLLLLLLPVVGMFYIFFNLGRRLVPAVWRWSKPTPGRRVIGSLGSVATLLLLAWLWAPQLPLSGKGPAAAWRAIGTRERGTLADAFVGLPFDEQAPRSTPHMTRGGQGNPGSNSVARNRHATLLDALRSVPVLGGVVSAVAPAHGAFIDNVRSVPVLGGAVSAVVPRHGTLVDNLRTAPLVGRIVTYVAPTPSHTAPPSSRVNGAGSTTSVGTGHGNVSGVSAQSGAKGGTSGVTSGGHPGPAPGVGAGTGATAVAGAGSAVQTPVAGVSGTVNGVVQTPVAGVSGTVNGVVQTPVAGVSGTVNGAVQTPVAGVSGTVNGVVQTPVAGVSGTVNGAVNGAVKTPVAGAAGTVNGAVSTPVAGVSGSVKGAVQTPVAGAAGTVNGAVKTPVAGVSGAANGAAGAVQTPLAGVQGKVP